MTVSKEKARKIHQESIIVDGLGYSQRSYYFEDFVDSMISVGVAAVNMTVVGSNDTPAVGLVKVEEWNKMIEKRNDKMLLVRNVKDIERAKKEKKVGIMMGTQDGTIIGDDINFLGIYKKLGMTIFQPTYTWQNLIGEGCGERTDGGLSSFGVKAIEEMNNQGMLIDLSHCAYQVTMDAIKFSKAPVVFTHTNPRALCDHARNKTDEQIKAMAAKGGVMGICSYMPLLTKDTRPTWDEFVNCLDYVVNLVGVDHVAIGSDFSLWTKEEYDAWLVGNPNLKPAGPQDGWTWRNIFVNDDGMVEYDQLFTITELLLDRGYSEHDVKKILGLNFMRVLQDVLG